MTDKPTIPPLTDVKSSNIAAIGHDGSHLYVKFSSGGVYRYENVPADIHATMAAAHSVGGFLHQTIKPGYKATKVG